MSSTLDLQSFYIELCDFKALDQPDPLKKLFSFDLSNVSIDFWCETHELAEKKSLVNNEQIDISKSHFIMKWTVEEKQRLYNAANTYVQMNQKVDWEDIQQRFPERTKVQLKAQFQNYLKTQTYYKQWSTYEKMLLTFCVSVYGNNWIFIQKNFFKHRQPEQLRVRYYNIKILREEREKILNDIRNNNIQVQNYKQKYIKNAISFYKIMCNRVRVKLGMQLENPTEVDQILGLTQTDPIEYKLLEMVENEMTIDQMDQMLIKLEQLLDQVNRYNQNNSKSKDESESVDS